MPESIDPDDAGQTEVSPDATPAPENVATDPASGPSQNADGSESVEPHADDKPGREAARYRRQLREVETERDTLAGQLDTARRAIVEHHLGNLKPAAFWQMHPEVADLVDDAGAVDPEKVAEAARGAYEDLGLPGVFSNTRKGAVGPYVPGEGTVPAGAFGNDGWTTAFKPKNAAGVPTV
jgi:hypothetical protein